MIRAIGWGRQAPNYRPSGLPDNVALTRNPDSRTRLRYRKSVEISALMFACVKSMARKAKPVSLCEFEIKILTPPDHVSGSPKPLPKSILVFNIVE